VFSGSRYHQLGFIWYYNAPAGAPPKSQGIRVTFDGQGFGAIVEILSDSSGFQIVYAGKRLERAAAEQFGKPVAQRRYVLERRLNHRKPLVVAGLLVDGPQPMGPFVYVRAMTKDITNVHCRCSASQFDTIRETVEYDLVPIKKLKELNMAPVGRMSAVPADAAPGIKFTRPTELQKQLRLPVGF